MLLQRVIGLFQARDAEVDLLVDAHVLGDICRSDVESGTITYWLASLADRSSRREWA